MSNFVIQTRQKAERLFPLYPTPAGVDAAQPVDQFLPLAGSEVRLQGPVEVEGYAEISVLMISNRPFDISFLESAAPAGSFVQTQSFAGVLSSGYYVVAERFSPVGSFMKMNVENIAAEAQSFLRLLVLGLPCP